MSSGVRLGRAVLYAVCILYRSARAPLDQSSDCTGTRTHENALSSRLVQDTTRTTAHLDEQSVGKSQRELGQALTDSQTREQTCPRRGERERRRGEGGGGKQEDSKEQHEKKKNQNSQKVDPWRSRTGTLSE